MPCSVFVDSRRHSGIVLDLSANGLFVQTSASPTAGDRVRVECHLAGQEGPAGLHTRVARRKKVPGSLRAVAQGGLGLRIEQAPEEFYSFVAEILRDEIAEFSARKPQAEANASASKQRGPTRLEKKARELALRRALGPRPTREPEQHSFRVRIALGTRSRILTVRASGVDEACAQALAMADAGDWRVLRCDQKDG